MGNGLCPECGCVMEESAEDIYMPGADDDTITEIVYECPCCGYSETTYDG